MELEFSGPADSWEACLAMFAGWERGENEHGAHFFFFFLLSPSIFLNLWKFKNAFSFNLPSHPYLHSSFPDKQCWCRVDQIYVEVISALRGNSVEQIAFRVKMGKCGSRGSPSVPRKRKRRKTFTKERKSRLVASLTFERRTFSYASC